MKTLILTCVALLSATSNAADSNFAEEFGKRWANTCKMAIGVADAMPPVQYAFRPDPGAMSFAEQIAHIAQTNYAFCAGLKDTATPPAHHRGQLEVYLRIKGIKPPQYVF